MSKHEQEFGAEEVIEMEDNAQGTAIPETAQKSDVGVTEKEELARQKKQERADEWARMKSNLRARKSELLALLDANGFDAQYVKDLDTLIGNERVPADKKVRQPKLALRNEFVQMFYDGEGEDALPQIGRIVKGMDLFVTKGLGKDKLNQLCAEAIKRASEPSKRHWITAVPDTEYPMVNNYQLVAVGADAPEGWTGFLPDELK